MIFSKQNMNSNQQSFEKLLFLQPYKNIFEIQQKHKVSPLHSIKNAWKNSHFYFLKLCIFLFVLVKCEKCLLKPVFQMHVIYYNKKTIFCFFKCSKHDLNLLIVLIFKKIIFVYKSFKKYKQSMDVYQGNFQNIFDFIFSDIKAFLNLNVVFNHFLGSISKKYYL